MVFPHYNQYDSSDCGPTCLRMIAKFYGKDIPLHLLRKKCCITRNGVSLLNISEAAKSIGMNTLGVKFTTRQLVEDSVLPCILHWNQHHFVVCYKIKVTNCKNNTQKYNFYISDPAEGKAVFNQDEFEKCWISSQNTIIKQGIALFIEPLPQFYNSEYNGKSLSKAINIRFFLKYISPHKKQLFYIMAMTLIASIIQLIFPFLSQAIIDKGIMNKDMGFIILILISQFILFFAQLCAEFIRSWTLLFVTAKINISLVSEYLEKLMKLPIRYFDSKMIGDIIQRIGDNDRIQSFFTRHSISIIFSSTNFVIFSIVLMYYNILIMGIFAAGYTLYIVWVLHFMHYRRQLDQKYFSQSALEQNNIIEIITGMQEIKLGNCEDNRIRKWKKIQLHMVKLGIKGMTISQYQQTGAMFLSQSTNFLICFIAANSVVNGNMTIGMMLSLSYITGQLSAPIGTFVNFAQSFQDAKISVERLSEIHNQPSEDATTAPSTKTLPENRNISLSGVWFSYSGSEHQYTLQDINIIIPQNQITAIVGPSGSGKTTLLKILLGFYTPQRGTIHIGNTKFEEINCHTWRKNVGVVMQSGFMFSDTIEKNITLDEPYDRNRFILAEKTAKIKDIVDSFPMKYNTKIGINGSGLSQGQKQRITIARAIYKNPPFLFFDEATNSLDTINEKEIMDQIINMPNKRTIVIIAHRLSTVKNADNIIVMSKGKVVEQGKHEILVKEKGIYYQLIRNQLEFI